MINQATFPDRAAWEINSTSGVPAREQFWRLFITAFLGDTVVIFSALALVAWVHSEMGWGGGSLVAQSTAFHWTDYGRHIVFGSVLFSLLLINFRMYSMPRMLHLRPVLSTVMKASLVWLLAYVSMDFLLHFDQGVNHFYVCAAFFTATFGLMGWRGLLHHFIARSLAVGRLRQRILFVGWSEHAAAFIDAITGDREHLYEVAGCVPSPQGRYSQTPPARLRKLGDYGDLRGLLHRHRVDMVLVADMSAVNGELVGLASLCEKELVEFKVIPSCFQVFVSGLSLESVSGIPVLGVSRLPLDNPLNLVLKEIVDVVGAAFGLLISLPIIAIFALLVYRESPGPVFYTQRRLGRHGQPFSILKIRSMRLDAERDGKPGWSVKDDPRRLRIGAFMRRWNIDELPQFWNVLKGDMSLVGPRPERLEMTVNFKEEIPHYNARHSVKPGLTGWAQVNGLRGDTDLCERIRYDINYIERANILWDIQIMFMTLLRQKNAC
jgi:exopolysaccharide biosynthesis polyprenyl glycosylphosphotransferase